MATKEIKDEAAASGAELLEDIEALCVRYGISRPVFVGMCAANGWRPGRQMTGKEFKGAVKAYQQAPMSRGRTKGGMRRVNT